VASVLRSGSTATASILRSSSTATAKDEKDESATKAGCVVVFKSVFALKKSSSFAKLPLENSNAICVFRICDLQAVEKFGSSLK